MDTARIFVDFGAISATLFIRPSKKISSRKSSTKLRAEWSTDGRSSDSFPAFSSSPGWKFRSTRRKLKFASSLASKSSTSPPSRSSWVFQSHPKSFFDFSFVFNQRRFEFKHQPFIETSCGTERDENNNGETEIDGNKQPIAIVWETTVKVEWKCLSSGDIRWRMSKWRLKWEMDSQR